MNGTGRHSRQANREVWFYPSDQTRLARQTKPYFLVGGLPGFTLPAMLFLFVGDFSFHGFSFEIFQSNLPLLPFTSISAPFSEPHQAVISVLGAKVITDWTGMQGQASCFLEKSPALRVVFFRKTLQSPNPYLVKHPKRKRPMRQKDALKKMSDKQEADKKV